MTVSTQKERNWILGYTWTGDSWPRMRGFFLGLPSNLVPEPEMLNWLSYLESWVDNSLEGSGEQIVAEYDWLLKIRPKQAYWYLAACMQSGVLAGDFDETIPILKKLVEVTVDEGDKDLFMLMLVGCQIRTGIDVFFDDGPVGTEQFERARAVTMSLREMREHMDGDAADVP